MQTFPNGDRPLCCDGSDPWSTSQLSALTSGGGKRNFTHFYKWKTVEKASFKTLLHRAVGRTRAGCRTRMQKSPKVPTAHSNRLGNPGWAGAKLVKQKKVCQFSRLPEPRWPARIMVLLAWTAPKYTAIYSFNNHNRSRMNKTNIDLLHKCQIINRSDQIDW